MSVILSLDTCGPYCAVSILDGRDVVVSNFEEMKRGQAERLFPLIQSSLNDCSRNLQDLSAIAVATGPGNFTGVRMCVSAARGLSLSLGIPAIGVTVLEAMAYGIDGRALCLIDARAGNIYAQLFKSGQAATEPKLLARSKLPELFGDVESIQGFDADVVAKEMGVANWEQSAPKPETYGLVSLKRNWPDEPAPAPIYLRGADAELPSEPQPVIVP